MDKPLIFFDLETTGVSITIDRIVQIAMIKVMPTGERIRKETLVNPGVPIPAAATEIHHITDEMVKNSPTFKQLSKGIFDFTSGCDLAGYNSDKFDIPLMMEEFNHAGIIWPEEGTQTLDVLKMERVITSHTLGETFKRYTGNDLDGAHDAMVDVEATITIMQAQIDALSKRDPVEPLSDVKSLAAIYNKDSDAFDIAGNFTQKDGKAYWNFGKHKGRLLDYDTSYCNWFLSNEFSIDSKRKLRAYLKTNKV